MSISGEEVFQLHSNVRYYARCLASSCAISWALGLIVFTIVEWIHTDLVNKHEHESSEDDADRTSHGQTVFLSLAGAVTFLSGVSGYWGSLHLEHGMVCAFSYVIFFSSVVELCVGAVALSFRKEAFDDDSLELIKNETENLYIIFEIQKWLKCCGSTSPMDWVDSEWWRDQREQETSIVVPISCCRPPAREGHCNSGRRPYRRLRRPKLVYDRVGGGVACACGIVKLFSFFAIHYLANLILSSQHRLQEIREAPIEAIPLRVVQGSRGNLPETQIERRLSTVM